MDFDPLDWRRTRIPKLAQLEALQRCLICKEFLRAPVITSCNHTFCSQCIRQHLMSESNCPLCKAEQFESNLKRVILLEEIVACFQAVRDDLIAVVKADPDVSAAPERPPERPERPEAARQAPDVEETSRPSLAEVIEVSDSDLPEPGRVAGRVLCPVCGESMTAEVLQRSHLDDCLSGKRKPKRKRAEIALFFGRKQAKPAVNHDDFYFGQLHKHHHDAKKLPKIDYASTSTPKLKEKLAALKLAVLGTRTQMELRYNQYYILHNANLDANHPATDLELRQKLNQWEKTHQAFLAPVGANTLFGLSHKSVADKDFPIRTWLDKHRDEFRDLVRAAKRSRRAKAATLPEPTPADPSVPAQTPDPTEPTQTEPTLTAQTVTAPAIPAPIASADPHITPEADMFDFSKSTLFLPH